MVLFYFKKKGQKRDAYKSNYGLRKNPLNELITNNLTQSLIFKLNQKLEASPHSDGKCCV